MNAIINSIVNFCLNKISFFYFGFLIIFAILFRIYFFFGDQASIFFVSEDQTIFLLNWLQELQNKGIVAFQNRFADYHAPYLYILYIISLFPLKTAVAKVIAIKTVSILFDILNAVIIAKIISQYQKNKIIVIFSGFFCFFTPTFFLNSTVWGQCDSIYAFFSLITIYYLLKNKYFLSLLFYGIAFSFKLQSIFLLPFLLLHFTLLHRENSQRFSWSLFLLIPACYIGTAIPLGFLSDWNMDVMFKTYVYQMYNSSSPQINIANFYQFFGFTKNSTLVLNMVMFAFFVIASVFFFLQQKLTFKEHREKIFPIIIFVTLTVVFFLPKMHERYYYLIDAVTIIYLFIRPKISSILIFIVFQLVSVFSYSNYLYGLSGKSQVDVIFYFLSLLVLAVWLYLLKEIFFDRKKIDS